MLSGILRYPNLLPALAAWTCIALFDACVPVDPPLPDPGGLVQKESPVQDSAGWQTVAVLHDFPESQENLAPYSLGIDATGDTLLHIFYSYFDPRGRQHGYRVNLRPDDGSLRRAGAGPVTDFPMVNPFQAAIAYGLGASRSPRSHAYDGEHNLSTWVEAQTARSLWFRHRSLGEFQNGTFSGSLPIRDDSARLALTGLIGLRPGGLFAWPVVLLHNRNLNSLTYHALSWRSYGLPDSSGADSLAYSTGVAGVWGPRGGLHLLHAYGVQARNGGAAQQRLALLFPANTPHPGDFDESSSVSYSGISQLQRSRQFLLPELPSGSSLNLLSAVQGQTLWLLFLDSVQQRIFRYRYQSTDSSLVFVGSENLPAGLWVQYGRPQAAFSAITADGSVMMAFQRDGQPLRVLRLRNGATEELWNDRLWKNPQARLARVYARNNRFYLCFWAPYSENARNSYTLSLHSRED